MFLQSRLQCLYILPASGDGKFPAVAINPGAVAVVEREHFDSVLLGNRALEALIADRALVPCDLDPGRNEHQLKKAADPEPPTQLRDSVPDVELKSKVEVASLDLSEPTEAKRKK